LEGSRAQSGRGGRRVAPISEPVEALNVGKQQLVNLKVVEAISHH
jgi:hypothetical protein